MNADKKAIREARNKLIKSMRSPSVHRGMAKDMARAIVRQAVKNLHRGAVNG